MKDVREMFNISYFDNKELSLKEHCDIYSNIKRELISILNKYDIKYVLAETEVIKDLSKENQSLKKQLETINKKYNFESKYRAKNYKMLREKDTRQKEFIEYLENEIKHLEHSRYVSFNEFDERKLYFYREILSKYEIITGGKDE